MKIPIITIGNSRGIRIPKTVLEQVNFTNEVELSVQKDHLVIAPASQTREGWSAAFKSMAQQGDDALESVPAPEWDDLEWEW